MFSLIKYKNTTLTNNLLICSFLVVFMSCSGMSPEQYLKYYDSHKDQFSDVIKRNNQSVTVVYVPVEYYIAQQMQADTSVSYDTLFKKYKNTLNILVVTKDEINQAAMGMESYSENVANNTFNRENDAFLIHGTDTVKTTVGMYNRDWGIAKENAFIFAFNKQSISGNILSYDFVFRDMTKELGTISVPLKNIIKRSKRLRK